VAVVCLRQIAERSLKRVRLESFDVESVGARCPQVPRVLGPMKMSCTLEKGDLYTCAPNYAVIGFAKAATTSTWKYLSQHPATIVHQHDEDNYISTADDDSTPDQFRKRMPVYFPRLNHSLVTSGVAIGVHTPGAANLNKLRRLPKQEANAIEHRDFGTRVRGPQQHA